MTSCGVEPAKSVTSVSSSDYDSLSAERIETTDFTKEKTQIKSITSKAQESSESNIITETDIIVATTENLTEEKNDMETSTIYKISKSTNVDTTTIQTTTTNMISMLTDVDTTTEKSQEVYEDINVETEQNYEIKDMNYYSVWNNDALKEIKSQRYVLADESSISSICNSFSQEELISQIRFMCPFNVATKYYQLKKFYPIEYIHIPNSDNSAGYCIYKLSEGGKLFVFFDDNPEGLYFVTNIFIVKDLLTRDDFNKLQSGMTLEDVEKIDSGTKVLNSINNDYLRFCQTTHIVKDGFIKIKYTQKEESCNSFDDNSNLVISSIEFIQNGSFIEFPDELHYDYVNGGMKYFIKEEDYAE